MRGFTERKGQILAEMVYARSRIFRRKFLLSIQIKLLKGQSWVNSGIIANRWLSEYRDMKLICKVRGQAPCLTEPPSQLINAGIALPPVKGT